MEDKTLLKEMSATFTAVVKPKLLALAKEKGERKILEEMQELISMETVKDQVLHLKLFYCSGDNNMFE
jgi:hypothetical protein